MTNNAGLFQHRKGGIMTFSGRVIEPLSPHHSDICIEDIAHHLSLQCRFTGATSRFYSVAEHSVMASYIGDTFRFEKLMHDSGEAYMGDLARPLKAQRQLGQAFRNAEKIIEPAIARKFGLTWPWPIEVKEADNIMLAAEALSLMPPNFPLTGLENYLPEAESIYLNCWEPPRAEEAFLHRFSYLAGEA